MKELLVRVISKKRDEAGLAFDRDGSDEQARGPTSSIKKLHHRLAESLLPF
jgi:hypothetical protein